MRIKDKFLSSMEIKHNDQPRSHSIGSTKKYIPPEPLCSLMFLDGIEKKDFKEALRWRKKRKRV